VNLSSSSSSSSSSSFSFSLVLLLIFLSIVYLSYPRSIDVLTSVAATQHNTTQTHTYTIQVTVIGINTSRPPDFNTATNANADPNFSGGTGASLTGPGNPSRASRRASIGKNK
jgi:hypothetical protein